MSNTQSTPAARLVVSLSPHDHGSTDTRRIMWTVVVALLPAVVASVVVFGPASLLSYGVAVASCVLTEALVLQVRSRAGRAAPVLARGRTLAGHRGGVSDGSAVITGLLLAMNVSPSLPLWQLALGGFFAIGVAKMVFGGIGQNPFNPALAGRAFLLASFPQQMTSFVAPGPDAIASATPLGALKEGLKAGMLPVDIDIPSFLDLFLGFRSGCLGEVSVLAILAGALILLAGGILQWELPVFFLLGLGGMTGIMWLADPLRYLDPLHHMMSGGAMLAAVFMITDMVTSPMEMRGRMVYAFLAGFLAALIRLFGAYPEGASYAILIMNAFVPLIDRAFRPARFGAGGPGRGVPAGKAAS